MSLQLVLTWPDKRLSPNARGHWATVARAKKAMRATWATLARYQGARPMAGPLLVHLRFEQPDRRHRDWDNLLASSKAGLDGLADVLGVDDSQWRISMDCGHSADKAARVVVTVTEVATDG